MTLWLSRLTISRAPSVSALKALIDPADRGTAKDAHHRLIWSAFADDPDRRRDFLWRAENDGRFHVLSARAPSPSPFFEPPEVKAFAPDLRAGDRLEFVLRANATRTRKRERNGREQRVHDDVVMHALKALPPGAPRDEARGPAAASAACEWMAGQGVRGGFAPLDVQVSDYSVQALPGHRGPRKGQPQFGVLDLTGILEVTDPIMFLDRVAGGFGRAKAFGCGLMMVRRAR